jgi:hypothetical protein
MSNKPRAASDLRVIYEGASSHELSVMFDLSVNEVNKRLVGKVAPVGVDAKAPRYRIREAAPYLCNVVFDPEEFIKSLSPAKLPAALQDAFWKAQINRQKFEEQKGDLWRTERVIEVLGNVFKTIRMTILMFNDTIEQKSDITPKQREIIQELGDGLLDTAHKNLVEAFSDYKPPADEHGTPLAEEKVPALHMEDVSVIDSNGARADDGFDDGFDD